MQPKTRGDFCYNSSPWIDGLDESFRDLHFGQPAFHIGCLGAYQPIRVCVFYPVGVQQQEIAYSYMRKLLRDVRTAASESNNTHSRAVKNLVAPIAKETLA